MLLIGLTGSIGMGKSTTAAMFRAAGVPVFDADAAVHRLYGGEAAPLVEAAFPGTTGADGVDRVRLGAAILGDAAALARLEAIVHPLVREERARFVAASRHGGSRLAVFDIPLLFETGAERDVDMVVVVSAPLDVQRARVLARPGMDEPKLDRLLARQMPDAEKRARAHMVIDTGRGLAPAEKAVGDLVRALSGVAAARVSSR